MRAIRCHARFLFRWVVAMGSCYGWLLWVDADWCVRSDVIPDLCSCFCSSFRFRYSVLVLEKGVYYAPDEITQIECNAMKNMCEMA